MRDPVGPARFPPGNDTFAVTAVMLLAVLVLVAPMQRSEAPPRPGGGH